MVQLDKKEFQKRLQRIEELVRTIESVNDQKVRAGAVELMQSLMELHGSAIEKMMEIVFEAGPAGAEILNRFAEDDLTASILMLYSLHPLDLNTRVMQAIDNARPYLRSHGGEVEIIGIKDGAVRLRLHANGNGCGSSATTLKSAVEEAIYNAAPDITSLTVESAFVQPVPASGLVQLKKAQVKK